MIAKLFTTLSALCLFSTAAFAQCGGCTDEAAKTVSLKPGKTIVETALGDERFSTLVTAVKTAGLVDALSAKGPFTVFAPTNDAFAKLPKGTVEALLKDKKQLTEILTYHVVSGQLAASDVVSRKGAVSLNGQRVDIRVDGKTVMVDKAKVVITDIFCSNGVIHVIDSVILPSSSNLAVTAKSAGQFGTLLAAAKAAGLVDALTKGGPYTVFAPTDAAFAKLPKGTVESLLEPANKDQLAAILKFHIVPGRVYSDAITKPLTPKTLMGQTLHVQPTKAGVKVGEAKVVAADVDASNGVIHVVDAVLLPKS
ncbi:MAG: fasciclin domain-containing protein [Planctomycetota bacterium]